MRQEIVPGLRDLTEAVHREGAAASIQLGHCGFFASPQVIGRRPLGASRKLCLYRLSRCEEMSEPEIEAKIDDFVRAARLAHQAGFDAVEIHAGHGYLLSQFLSPWTNNRQDRYGGAMENRQSVTIPAAYVGGVLSLADMERLMQAGFEFAQVGRAIVCDPDFVNKLQAGTLEASDCDHCNRCIAAMEAGGVYCVTYSQGQTEMKHTG